MKNNHFKWDRICRVMSRVLGLEMFSSEEKCRSKEEDVPQALNYTSAVNLMGFSCHQPTAEESSGGNGIINLRNNESLLLYSNPSFNCRNATKVGQ